MSAATGTDTEHVLAAAAAALPLLPVPAGGQVAAGSLAEIPPEWPAVSRAFTGGRSGMAVVVLDPAAAAALTGALADAAAAVETPGGVDLATACLPALDAMSTSLGPTAGQDAVTTSVATLVEQWGDDADLPVAVVLVAGVAQAYVVLVLEPAEAAMPMPRVVRGTDPAASSRGMDLLRSVPLELTAEIGRTRMTIHELLSLTPGAVVELDRPVGSPADVLVNGRLFARGEVVVVDEDFAIRITEIVDPAADLGTT